MEALGTVLMTPCKQWAQPPKQVLPLHLDENSQELQVEMKLSKLEAPSRACAPGESTPVLVFLILHSPVARREHLDKF